MRCSLSVFFKWWSPVLKIRIRLSFTLLLKEHNQKEHKNNGDMNALGATEKYGSASSVSPSFPYIDIPIDEGFCNRIKNQRRRIITTQSESIENHWVIMKMKPLFSKIAKSNAFGRLPIKWYSTSGCGFIKIRGYLQIYNYSWRENSVIFIMDWTNMCSVFCLTLPIIICWDGLCISVLA